MAAAAAEKSAMAKLADDVAQVASKVAELDAAVEVRGAGCGDLRAELTRAKGELATEAGMGFLQVKNHALLNYTKMELFFALLKLEQPDKVKDHPVFKELVRYRTLLERIRPLDRKMKYQVDKMLKVALSGGKGMDESLDYAPNPDQLVGQDGAGDDDDAEGSGDEEGRSKDGIYRAPRLASVPYEEDERAAVKQAKKDERNRKRLQKSTILSELREEFSERPTEILASGTSVLDKEIARDEAEKKAYEESRFVRLVTSRKDKIRKRQREHEANRADHVTDIDNFAGVQNILAGDKGKRRIPTHTETTKRIGGKTGGIFSHIETPVEKKRKGASRPPSSTSQHQPTRQQPRSTPAQPASSSAKKTGGKKKVVFSSIF